MLQVQHARTISLVLSREKASLAEMEAVARKVNVTLLPITFQRKDLTDVEQVRLTFNQHLQKETLLKLPDHLRQVNGVRKVSHSVEKGAKLEID